MYNIAENKQCMQLFLEQWEFTNCLIIIYWFQRDAKCGLMFKLTDPSIHLACTIFLLPLCINQDMVYYL
jgi:hypothetical protein